jgi:predicted porin
MIGGLRGTASRLAIAAGFCVMGVVIFAQKPARAADLGGDCCADLEERVAELEATTVRKGNKKVSVQIYGKVNEAILSWDDGAEQKTFEVNNNMESTRMGIKGSAKIGGDWSAGYRLEWEFRRALSSSVNQWNSDNSSDVPMRIRWSQMYVANKQWGTVNWGLTATPKYDVTKDTMEYISTEQGEGGGLSDTLVPDFRMNDSFRLRETGFNNGLDVTKSLTWSNIARCYSAGDQFNCSTRRNGVSYNSPSWAGFSTQWGYFEDNIWGGAVRYRNTDWADTWLLAASAGYEKFLDERIMTGAGGVAGFRRDLDEWAGSAALKHKPTGLFLMGVWGVSQSSDSNVKGAFNGQGAPDMTSWNVEGGIQRKVSALGLDRLGESALWGGFSQVNDGFAPGSNPNDSQFCNPNCQKGTLGTPYNMLLSALTFPGINEKTQVTGSNVNTWFIAADQQLENAAMHIYLAYEHFEADVSLIDINQNKVPLSLDNFDLFYAGGRLYF